MRPLASALVASILLATPAAADWPASGERLALTNDSVNGTSLTRILDLPSGDLAVFCTGVGGNANGYNVQRVGRNGDLGPGWPSLGATFGQIGKAIRPYELGFTVDDSSCAWQVGSTATGKPGAHFINPDGVLTPSGYPWPVAGTASSNVQSAFAPAPGGIYVFCNTRVQRFTRAGTVATGWPAAGQPTIGLTAFGDVAALADDAGGVMLLSTFTSSGFPEAQRINSNHTGWAAPLGLSADPADANPDYFQVPILPALIHSGAASFIAGWTTPANSAVKTVKLQRFSIDGTIDPAWPDFAVQAVAPDSIAGITLLPDNTGGAYVLWYAHGMPRGTHVRSNGQFEPGTSELGTPLPGPFAQYQPPLTHPLLALLDYVPADVTPDGRLIFAWDDLALAPTKSFRVRWMRPALTSDPSEPDSGRLIMPVGQVEGMRAVHSDGIGGAFVAWGIIAPASSPADVMGASGPRGAVPSIFGGNVDVGQTWMTRLLPSALVGVQPPPTARSALALSVARPNPTHDVVALDLTLPDDSPARLVLFDLAGRERRTVEVRGAGERTARIDGLAALPPGLYLVRLRHRSGECRGRIVLTR